MANNYWKYLKGITEVIGIVAILISLILVIRELQQNRQIALGEFDMIYAQNRILSNQLIADHPGVWLRGAANESLPDSQEVIFRRMVENENDLAVYKINQANRLGDYESAATFFSDFVGLLHDNPGVRRVWMERERRLLENRRGQGKAVVLVDWFNNVIVGLEKLEGH